MADLVDNVLGKLAGLIAEGRFEDLETEGLEIKPVPAATGDWRERHVSINAFLNTRGGILLLGFKEEGRGARRRWIFTGYREEAENKLKEFPRLFKDRRGAALDLGEAFRRPGFGTFREAGWRSSTWMSWRRTASTPSTAAGRGSACSPATTG